ncbi:MAG: TlpA disulfide reductase family protein [Chitinophagaceae bacterium]
MGLANKSQQKEFNTNCINFTQQQFGLTNHGPDSYRESPQLVPLMREQKALTLAAIKTSTMRLILSVVFLATTCFSFAQSSVQTATREEMDSLMCPKGRAADGRQYMEFRITNEARTIDNQNLRGKVVLINFWFEDCHPCMAEMEALNNLFKKMESNKDFVFISLTWNNKETIKRVKEKFGLAFEVFSAPGGKCQRLNFGCGYPTSIVLDKLGVIKFRHHGGSIIIEQANEFIEKTLLPEIQSLL